MSFLNKIFGDPNAKVIAKLQPKVEEINALEKEYERLSAEQLRNLKDKFKKELESGKTLDDILPRAFAACREASKRTLGQRHFDVQLMGGIVLHKGQIAEMRTGEGKTLTSTLSLYLNALEAKGTHVVTVNDYLARRDTVWMGQIYHALGMSVGCIQHMASFLYDPRYETNSDHDDDNNNDDDSKENKRDKERDETGAFKVEQSYLRPCSRKEAYAADMTYGTNNEFGFDYLRDNMAYEKDQVVQRDLHYAIVDEIDSILIDEARTPLIISAPDTESSERYVEFAELVKRLKENEDYNVDEKMRAATLTDQGISRMEKWLGMDNIYTEGGITMVHHIEQALRAEALFKLDRDYVVKDGEVIIVDEFTGRLMHGRRYSEGLHQAIEAKEGVVVQRESMTLATVTFQNFFRLYKKLAGMTGTAATEAEEFAKIYNLEVTSVPTNMPMIRKDLPDRIYKTEQGKFRALIGEVRERNQKGQPVLIGTISIEKNEMIGNLLEKEGLRPQILNAKHHEKEGQIIAQAGRVGTVTVATNMAGRGVDIILGGNPPDPKSAQMVKEAGGLHVIGTERHESRRIDNQLRGRSGRQGDSGSSQFYVSTDDDLMRIFGSGRIKKVMDTLKIPEDMPIENSMISRSLEAAQKKVEGHNFDIRKHLVEYDDVINKHRETIYKKRREILSKDDVKDEILHFIEGEIEHLVSFHTASDNPKDWNLKEVVESMRSMISTTKDVKEFILDVADKNLDKLNLAEKRTKIIEYVKEIALRVYNEEERTVNEALGDGAFKKIEKRMALQAIDTLWIEHLEAMDHLRTGIGLRGYGQRDPLIEYKKEAYRLFSELMSLISKQIVYSIYKVGAVQMMAPSVMPFRNVRYKAPSKTMQEGRSGIALSATEGAETEREALSRQNETPLSDNRHYDGRKVGRNEPCPCGSKKSDGTSVKFKHCHGK